jgi:excisionase family DNA binding protein
MKNKTLTRSAVWLFVASAAFALPCAAAPKGLPDALPESVLDRVYTLDEAAEFLRVPVTDVERMARKGSLPGRAIGGQWRFSRIALVQWLNQDRPLKIALAPQEEHRTVAQREQLARAELAQYSGRGGVTGNAPMPEPTIPSKVGEAPTTKSAEQVFLRDQGVLLKARETTVEFGLSYQRSQRSQTLVNVINLNPIVVNVETPQRNESNALDADVTLRYGLMDDLQLTASVPYRYRRSAGFVAEVVGKDHDHRLGDASIGLLGVATREAVGRPTVIWSLNAIAPTGTGDTGVGAGLSLAKSYDPVVLYGGLSYMHGVDTDFNDTRRTLAKHNVSFNLGYAFAVNDSIALNSQLVGNYRSYGADPTNFRRLSREQYQLQFGLTYLLTPKVYVEPSIGIGLGGDSPELTFGLRIPYTL